MNVEQASPLRANGPRHQPAGGLTRRAVLPRLAVGGFGALVATRGIGTAAQEATPGVDALPSVVVEYIAAFEAFDLDRVIATHAEDVTFEEVPTGRILEGREAIRANLEGFSAAFSDFSVEYTSAFASGAWAAGEWVVNARYTGQLEGLPPGEGQAISVRGVDVLELADGLVQHIREYPDFLGLLTQIGVIPGPEEALADATPAG